MEGTKITKEKEENVFTYLKGDISLYRLSIKENVSTAGAYILIARVVKKWFDDKRISIK